MPQQINLIDDSLRPVKQRLPPAALLATVAVALALLVAHLAWEKWALARAVTHAVAPLPVVADTAQDTGVQARKTARLAQREALRDLLRLQLSVAEGSAELVRSIIAAMPENMWLTEMEVGATRTLKLSGGAADSASFGQFTSSLERIEPLKGLPLHTVRLEPRETEAGSAGPSPATPAARLFTIVSGASEDTVTALAAPAASGQKP